MAPARRAWSAANPGNRAARAELLEAIAAFAAPQLNPDGPLLDCGRGNGWLLEALVATGVAPGRAARHRHQPGPGRGRLQARPRSGRRSSQTPVSRLFPMAHSTRCSTSSRSPPWVCPRGPDGPCRERPCPCARRRAPRRRAPVPKPVQPANAPCPSFRSRRRRPAGLRVSVVSPAASARPSPRPAHRDASSAAGSVPAAALPSFARAPSPPSPCAESPGSPAAVAVISSSSSARRSAV